MIDDQFKKTNLKPTNLPIGGFQASYDEAEWIVFGNPLDQTASFRSGCKNGPKEIRRFASNIETVNPFNQKDIAEVFIHDLGDLTGENLLKLGNDLVQQIEKDKKILTLGGEHTITYHNVERYSDALFVVFDAHCDLRDEYQNNKFSHACVIRRILEYITPEQLIFIGIRAVSQEERKLLEENDEIGTYWGHSWSKDIEYAVIEEIKKRMTKFNQLYLSIDMDGFDPAYCPGVGNPEPLGLTSRQFFNFFNRLPKIDGADITELNPVYDNTGKSQVLAARLAFSILSQ